jgi:hypothetical protein
MFREVVELNCTMTPVDCAVLNPLYSALTSYVPILRFGNVYVPALLETAV